MPRLIRDIGGGGAERRLEKRLEHMDYRDYKTKGLPTGSGQIEGVKKSVIGGRMKGGVMHWSRESLP